MYAAVMNAGFLYREKERGYEKMSYGALLRSFLLEGIG